MNKYRLLNILKQPENLDYETDLPELKELIEAFPYYATAYTIMARLLHEQKSIYYDKYEKLSAIYTGDREILREYISRPAKAMAPVGSEAVAAEVKEEVDITYPAYTETTAPPFRQASEVETLQTDAPAPEIATTEAAGAGSGKDKEETLPAEIAEEVGKTVSSYEEAADVQQSAATEEQQESGDTTAEVAVAGTTEHQPQETEVVAQADEEAKEGKPAGYVQAEQEPGEPDTAEHTSTIAASRERGTTSAEEPDAPEAEKPQDMFTLEKLNIPPTGTYDYFASYYKRTKPEAEVAATDNVEDRDAGAGQQQETEKFEPIPEKLSFSSWLELIDAAEPAKEQKNIQNAAPGLTEGHDSEANSLETLPKKPSRGEVDDLIMKFIQEEPKIRPAPTRIFSAEEMAKKSAEEDTTLASETLANIYIKQGLTLKAIEIFQQLILRYPQKSNYFARKIDELKKEG